MPAAKASKGYSGAELEVCCQTALRTAFNNKPRLTCPTADMFLAAVKAQTPLSVTMREQIDALQRWCKDGRARSAGATYEEDDVKSDIKALEQKGLPDLLSHAEKA
jgi:hypothetical protein